MAAWDGSYKAGINFRTTSAYVTDPANTGWMPSDEDGNDLPGAQTVTLAGTGDTIACGWAASGGTPSGSQITGAGTRDRDNTFDPRVAGIHFIDANSIRDFVITLPSTGDYLVWLGAGDPSNGTSGGEYEILDSTTSRMTLTQGAAASGAFYDATDALQTPPFWAISHDGGTGRALRINFTTTTMRLRLGTASNGHLVAIAHIALMKYTPATFERKNSRETVVSASSTSWTVRIPKDTVDGELLLFQFVTNTTAVSTGSYPSGVTISGTAQDASADSTQLILQKIASSESDTLAFTGLWTAGQTGICRVMRWAGANATTPINQTAQSSTASGTSVAGPSITPNVDGCWIVQFVGTDPATGAYQGVADTSPAAAIANSGKDNGSLAYSFIQEYLQPTAAALALDATGLTSDAYAFHQIAIAPAASAGSATALPGVGAITINGLAATVNSITSITIKEVFINEAGSPVSNRTGMSLLIWYAGNPIGAPDLSYSALTTDAAGTASWNIALGGLTYNQTIFYVATDGGSSLSAYTCARMIPTYA